MRERLGDLNHEWFGDFLEKRNKKGGSKRGLVGGPGETRLGVVDRGFGFCGSERNRVVTEEETFLGV
jgi:hypothetical protein